MGLQLQRVPKSQRHTLQTPTWNPVITPEVGVTLSGWWLQRGPVWRVGCLILGSAALWAGSLSVTGCSALTVCPAPRPPPTRCQQHPHQSWQPQMSPDISRCPLGAKSCLLPHPLPGVSLLLVEPGALFSPGASKKRLSRLIKGDQLDLGNDNSQAAVCYFTQCAASPSPKPRRQRGRSRHLWD